MSALPEFFSEWRASVASEIRTALEARREPFGEVHGLGPDAVDRLARFAVGGKLIRGGLVCLGCMLERGSVSESGVGAGAAMELFQSALLIHDDIMDRDEQRRGEASIHHQYAGTAGAAALSDAVRVGESLGICAGDIAFFVAFELLSRLDASPEVRNRVMSLAARELQYVGVAQMADVYRGAEEGVSGYDPGEETRATLNVYLYKTGRYTFSLPLMMGAVIGGANERLVVDLESLGEKLGVLFQIKDDEIGLFGREGDVGKPIGSDVREGKKTLFYTELLASADEQTIQRLDGVFGNPAAGSKDVDWFRSIIESSGARERVNAYLSRNAEEAEHLIGCLSEVDESAKDVLLEMHRYNLERTR